jgi:hypothetical protein
VEAAKLLFAEHTKAIADNVRQHPVLEAIPVAIDLDKPSQDSFIAEIATKFHYDAENRVLYLIRSLAGETHSNAANELNRQLGNWAENNGLISYVDIGDSGHNGNGGHEPDVSFKITRGHGNGPTDDNFRVFIEVECRHRSPDKIVAYMQEKFGANVDLCSVLFIKFYNHRVVNTNNPNPRRSAVAILWSRQPGVVGNPTISQSIDFGTVDIATQALNSWRTALNNPTFQFNRVNPVPHADQDGQILQLPLNNLLNNWTITIPANHLLNGAHSVRHNVTSPLLVNTLAPGDFEVDLFQILSCGHHYET